MDWVQIYTISMFGIGLVAAVAQDIIRPGRKTIEWMITSAVALPWAGRIFGWW